MRKAKKMRRCKCGQGLPYWYSYCIPCRREREPWPAQNVDELDDIADDLRRMGLERESDDRHTIGVS